MILLHYMTLSTIFFQANHCQGAVEVKEFSKFSWPPPRHIFNCFTECKCATWSAANWSLVASYQERSFASSVSRMTASGLPHCWMSLVREVDVIAEWLSFRWSFVEDVSEFVLLLRMACVGELLLWCVYSASSCISPALLLPRTFKSVVNVVFSIWVRLSFVSTLDCLDFLSLEKIWGCWVKLFEFFDRCVWIGTIFA